jgi:hypothetical protein
VWSCGSLPNVQRNLLRRSTGQKRNLMCVECGLVTSKEEPDFHAGLQGRIVWILSKFLGDWRTSHKKGLPVLTGHTNFSFF